MEAASKKTLISEVHFNAVFLNHKCKGEILEFTDDSKKLPISLRPQRVLVFINPVSGKKESQKIYDQVKDVFLWSRMEVSIIETERAGHAKEYVF